MNEAPSSEQKCIHGATGCVVCAADAIQQDFLSAEEHRRPSKTVSEFLRRCARMHLRSAESQGCDPEEAEDYKKRAAWLLKRAAIREARGE